jgi:hypothetical protein
MKGVYWLGNGYKFNCSWRLSDRQITDTVMAIKDNPKFSGIYYIAEEPHPALCPDAPQRLAERTALIHSLDPRGRTFVVVLNNSAAPTEFAQMKDAADYIGVIRILAMSRTSLPGAPAPRSTSASTRRWGLAFPPPASCRSSRHSGKAAQALTAGTPPTIDCPRWPRRKSCWPSGTRRCR